MLHFHIEILYLLILHRVLWERDSMKSDKGVTYIPLSGLKSLFSYQLLLSEVRPTDRLGQGAVLIPLHTLHLQGFKLDHLSKNHIF